MTVLSPEERTRIRQEAQRLIKRLLLHGAERKHIIKQVRQTFPQVRRTTIYDWIKYVVERVAKLDREVSKHPELQRSIMLKRYERLYREAMKKGDIKVVDSLLQTIAALRGVSLAPPKQITGHKSEADTTSAATPAVKKMTMEELLAAAKLDGGGDAETQ